MIALYIYHNTVALTMHKLCLLQSEWTPLHTAVKQGHISVVETLIKLGADVNAGAIVSYA